ncbi:MAG: extracellular solute-binding protein [Chloroflexota bacterium]|nr:extracellular solute-binding protein [Chloroflexota bacterium]
MRKIFYPFIGVLAAVLLLTSCSQSAPPPTQEDDMGTTTPTLDATVFPTSTIAATPTDADTQKTIRIWHAWDEPYVPALVEIISNFQEINPNVHFDVLYIPGENLLERYIEEARAGAGPSLLLGPAEWGAILYDEGLIDDLDDKFDVDVFERFNPAALNQMRYKDAIMGLPYQIDGVVMFRNGSIIPESADTFDELVSLAQSFSQGEIIGAVLDRGFFFSGGHLDGVGGSLMDEDGNPAFNDPQGVEWINLLIDFELVGPTTYLSERDQELFQAGSIGIIIDGTWNTELHAEAIGKENLVIDPWPVYGDGSLSGYVRAEDQFLNSQLSANNLDITLEFMQYFSSPDAQTILAAAGMIPAVTDLQLVGDINQRHTTQAIIALAGGSAYPALPEMTVYLAPMDVALRSVFDLGVAPEIALQTAEDMIIIELENFWAARTPTP